MNKLETETPQEFITRRNIAEINGPVPFLFYVWLKENGDDQYRPVAATMDESDAEAVAVKIVDEFVGTTLVLFAGERPTGAWHIYKEPKK